MSWVMLVEVVGHLSCPPTISVSVGPTWVCCSSASDAFYDVVLPASHGMGHHQDHQCVLQPLLEAKSGASLYLLGPLAGLFHLAENGFF